MGLFPASGRPLAARPFGGTATLVDRIDPHWCSMRADFIDRDGRTVGRWLCPLPHGPRGSLPAETIAAPARAELRAVADRAFRRSERRCRVGGLDRVALVHGRLGLLAQARGSGTNSIFAGAVGCVSPASRIADDRAVESVGRISDTVRTRLSEALAAAGDHDLADPDRVAAANRLSTEINVALAARRHCEPVCLERRLAGRLQSGPAHGATTCTTRGLSSAW